MIAYEPHPVSPERKAELRAAGFKILDIKYKPADEQGELPVAVVQKPKRRGAK